MATEIRHENGPYWVAKDARGFHAMVSGLTHAVSDSTYTDESVAIARVNYLAKTHTEGKNLERARRLNAGAHGK
jgi:hypothetical protein